MDELEVNLLVQRYNVPMNRISIFKSSPSCPICNISLKLYIPHSESIIMGTKLMQKIQLTKLYKTQIHLLAKPILPIYLYLSLEKHVKMDSF